MISDSILLRFSMFNSNEEVRSALTLFFPPQITLREKATSFVFFFFCKHPHSKLFYIWTADQWLTYSSWNFFFVHQPPIFLSPNFRVLFPLVDVFEPKPDSSELSCRLIFVFPPPRSVRTSGLEFCSNTKFLGQTLYLLMIAYITVNSLPGP